jgi:hypothetical protein
MAIGSTEGGRANERASARGSMVGTSAISQSDADATRRPRQQDRNQNRQQIDIEHARRRVVPRRPDQRKPGNAGLSADVGHVVPLARITAARGTLA